LPVPLRFLCNDSLRLPDTTHSAKVMQLQVQTDCSVHSLRDAFVYILQNHYFICQLFAATSCLLLHHIIVTTICRLPTPVVDWQQEMTNYNCQVKYGCNPYRIGALAPVSQLCSCIIKLQFLYLRFHVLIYYSPINTMHFCYCRERPIIYVQICSVLSSSQH
jgi:hypothetical protein